MIETLEFLLGMGLAYLLMSPRLRRAVAAFLTQWQTPTQGPTLQNTAPAPEVKQTKAGQLITDSESIRAWMDRNPDLRRANEAK